MAFLAGFDHVSVVNAMVTDAKGRVRIRASVDLLDRATRRRVWCGVMHGTPLLRQGVLRQAAFEASAVQSAPVNPVQVAIARMDRAGALPRLPEMRVPTRKAVRRHVSALSDMRTALLAGHAVDTHEAERRVDASYEAAWNVEEAVICGDHADATRTVVTYVVGAGVVGALRSAVSIW